MLNIITGRTGSGKTRYIRELSSKLALENNLGIVMIVPEQFSFETEKSMLSLLGNEKIGNIHITSFSRLAERLLPNGEKNADDGTKAVLMSLALDTLNDKIEIYSRYKNSPALLKDLLAFYKEVKKCRISFETLSSLSAKVKKQTFSKKLYELSQIFTVYEALLFKNYQDDNRRLDMLYDYLLENKYFKNKTVFVDGFSGFSAQEYKILERIISDCDNVYVTFCCDIEKNNGRYELFYNACSEIKKLKLIANRCGVEIAPVKKLKIDKRFKPTPLNLLEEAVFSDTNAGKYDDSTDSVTIFPCHTKFDECDAVSAEIKRLVRTENYRYRDIAVIERSEGSYKNQLLSSFRKYDIDCFEDNRQPVLNQPLIVFLFALFDIIIYGFETESVLRLLKTRLYGFSVEKIAMIEDYCLLWRITPSQWKMDWTENPSGLSVEFSDSDKKQLEVLNQLRKKIVAPILSLKNKIIDADGETISKEVFQFLKNNGIDENLKTFVKELINSGEEDLFLEQDRIWKMVVGIFDDLYQSVGKSNITVARYAELFNILASSEDLGQLPSGVDEVILGSADRIRVSSPKVVFIVGANTGVFPAQCSGGVLLSDAERCELIEKGAELVSNLEYNSVSERFIAYHALTLATEKLYVSYSTIGSDSEELTPSEIVSEIKSVVKNPQTVFFNSLREIESRRSAFTVCAKERNNNTVLSASIDEYFKINGTESEKNMLAKIEKTDFSIENSHIATELFGKNMFISASKTEKYYKCPFEYFCEYGIKAVPRREAVMDSAQVGIMVHNVLEMFVKRYSKKQFLVLSKDEVSRAVNSIIEEYIENSLGGIKGKTLDFIRSVELIRKTSLKVVLRLIDEFAHSDFEPVNCELSINYDGDIAPYLIKTDDGSTVKIIGKVDRVDRLVRDDKSYIRIVDYKTGTKKFDLSDVFAGINMQMLIYLFAIWQNGEKLYGDIVPAGILYCQARDYRPGKNKLSRDATAKMVDELAKKELKMSGMVLNSVDIVNAMENDGEGIFIPASIDKKGYVKGSVISADSFVRLRKRVDKIIGEMSNRLHNGRIEAYPIEKTCDYCKYKDICRREDDNEFREYEKMKHSAAIELLNGDDENV